MALGNLVSMIAGLLFGLGLGLAGMLDPSNVQGFLDIFGAWDPTLMFVMAGGIAVHLLFWRIIKHQASPLFDHTFHLPNRTDIDKPLLVGAAIFGIGWGLGGYCPGPGLASLGSQGTAPMVFVATMVVGMLLQHKYDALRLARRATLQA